MPGSFVDSSKAVQANASVVTEPIGDYLVQTKSAELTKLVRLRRTVSARLCLGRTCVSAVRYVWLISRYVVIFCRSSGGYQKHTLTLLSELCHALTWQREASGACSS